MPGIRVQAKLYPDRAGIQQDGSTVYLALVKYMNMNGIQPETISEKGPKCTSTRETAGSITKILTENGIRYRQEYAWNTSTSKTISGPGWDRAGSITRTQIYRNSY